MIILSCIDGKNSILHITFNVNVLLILYTRDDFRPFLYGRKKSKDRPSPPPLRRIDVGS